MKDINYYADFLIKIFEEPALAEAKAQGGPKGYETMEDYLDYIAHLEHCMAKIESDRAKNKISLIKRSYNASLGDALFVRREHILKNRDYFLEKYGEDLLDLYAKRKERVEKIIESGKIKSDSQYYCIREYIDMIEGIENCDILYQLVDDYEIRLMKKAERQSQK